jgi:integrase
MGVWKDKVRKHWCYSFQYQRKNYAARGFKDRREAEQARVDRRTELKTPTQTDTSLLEVCNVYLDYSEKAHVYNTFSDKRRTFSRFFDFIGFDIPVNNVTTKLISQFLATRPTNCSHNINRKHLSALFAYAKDILEVVDRNPCKKIKNLPHTSKRKVIPKETDIIKLLLVANKDEKDLLIVLLHTLARIDEVYRLTWQDVNFEKKILTKWTRKTKSQSYKAIPVTINQELYDTLWNMWQNRKQEKYVFLNPVTMKRYTRRHKFMRGLCKRAGIEPYFTFHTLRHLMASLMADNPKISTKTISKILGHSNLKTTEIYLHELEGANADAMNSISGKFDVKEELKGEYYEGN